MKHATWILALLLLMAIGLTFRDSDLQQHHSTVKIDSAEPLKTGAKVIKFEAVADPNLMKTISQESSAEESLFERELTDLFANIPKFRSEELSSEDLHGYTKMEIQEADALAQIQNLISKNKNFPQVTQRLYSKCMIDSELAATVRALCYFHALELSVALNNSEEIVAQDIPLEIKQLSMKLRN